MVLPLALMALSAWMAWRDAWQAARQEVEQAASAIAEYGLRVLDAHEAAAARLESLLRGLSDAEIRAQGETLHRELRRVISETWTIEDALVFDREGAVLLASMALPAPPHEEEAPPGRGLQVFRALAVEGAPDFHISGVHQGRLVDGLVFAYARRRRETGNDDLPPGGFDGFISLPIQPAHLVDWLRRFLPQSEDVAALVRTDGAVLVRSAALDADLWKGDAFARATAGLPARALYEARSAVDGAPRLYAADRVGGWPVYAVAGRARADILAAWRRQVGGQVAVGVPATLALLGLALAVRRGQRALADSHAGLEARVAERSVALAESEGRLLLAMRAASLGWWEVDLSTGRVIRGGWFVTGDRGPDGEAGTIDVHIATAIHPDDRERCRQALRDVVEQRTSHYRLECRVRDPACRGEGWVWQEVFGSVVARDPATGAPRRLGGVARDITARRHAEAALVEGEARLRLALESAGLGTWEIDLRTGKANRSSNILGLPPDLPLAGFTMEHFIATFVHPDDAALLRAAIEGAATGGRPLRTSYRVRLAPDAPWRWLESYGGVVARDPETGAPQRVAGMVRDVTGPRAAAAALAESERRLQQALEAGRVYTVETDLATDVIRRTRTAAAILGLPPAEAVRGRTEDFLRAVHPDDRERVLAATRRDPTPDRPDFSVRFRYSCPDGRLVWLQNEGRVRFGPDGAPRRISGLARDVTAEAEADAARQEGEARLRAAAEGAGFGIYEIEFAAGRAWFDARAAEVLGAPIPAEAWIRLDGPEWAAMEASLHPEDRGPFAAAWQGVVSGQAEGWAVESRLRRPDGSWTWDLCHGRVLERDPATGRPRRLVGIVQDVTERRRLEEEMRQGQKLQALGALAGGIAHDFNNVLQAITGAAALLRRQPGRQEAAARAADLLAQATRRGASITGRLLAFARRSALCTEAIDPAVLLEALREMLAPTLGPRIDLRVEAPEGLPPLLADRGQLETALVNLATNARDAMPGGGTLTISAAPECVGVVAAPAGHGAAAPAGGGPMPGRYLRLTVRDTGTGMDAATLARVTEPFFTTKPSGEGTGLGLPMVKALAEQSGGAFAIASAPGEGTTVTLWFPEATAPAAEPAPPDEAAAPAPSASGPGTAACLLLVDDEPAVRETIAEELESMGYRVLCVAGAAEALAVLDRGEAVDALVTDLTMPGLDGVRLIAEARRRRAQLPALLLTGHAEEFGGEAASDDRAGGGFVLLRKPATGAAVDVALRRLLGDDGPCGAGRSAAGGGVCVGTS